MQKIIFHSHKHKIAEFEAETLSFAQELDGLLLTATGEMVQQETDMLYEVGNHKTSCRVEIIKDGETVIDQAFQLTFFTLEQEALAVLLQ